MIKILQNDDKYNAEKIVDHMMQEEFYKVFHCFYNTRTTPILFNKLRPDGWFILHKDNHYDLLIIENKFKNIHENKGLEQAIKYYNIVQKNLEKQNKENNINQNNNYFKKIIIPNFVNYYLIIGTGSNKTDFGYTIYINKNNQILKTNLSFNHFI